MVNTAVTRKLTDGLPLNEVAFRASIEESASRMMKYLSREEQIKVGFVPIVIGHLAFRFADLCIKEAAKEKIEVLKQASRAYRTIEDNFIRDIRKDLDARHYYQVTQAVEEFLKANEWHLTTFYFSVNNEVGKHSELRYRKLRTLAHMSIILVMLLSWHNRKMDKLVRTKMMENTPTIINPHVKALGELMKAYIGDAIIRYDGSIKTSIEILKKDVQNVRLEMD